MISVTVLIEAFDLVYIQRPHNYKIEAQSDKKDILRIKTAFQSMANELSVLTYDNAVWSQTYQYMDKKNSDFTKNNFIKDSFMSININGVHLYDKKFTPVWGKVYNKGFTKLITFPAFSKPSTFIKKNVIITLQQINENKGKPVTQSGYIYIEDELILFAATSIFPSSAQGEPNGTLVFWRYVDKNVINDLQKRAGITFTINNLSESLPQATLAHGSLRTAEGDINTSLTLFRGSGVINITYKAPARLFDVNWFNHSTVITLTSFSLILLTLTLLTHFVIIRPILIAGEQIKSIVNIMIAQGAFILIEQTS